MKKNDFHKEYLKIKKIKKNYNFKTFDEAHVFTILNRKSNGKRKTLDLITNILNDEKPNSNLGKQSKWYTTSLDKNSNALKWFLTTNSHVANLGFYDQKRKVFQIYSDTKIVVDGSNVAWNNGNRAEGDKPKAKNIQLVIEKIREFGFSEIIVLCDANLNYDVEDKTIFDDLKKSKLIKNVPSHTDADEFIISYAKKFEARIITNDTYSKDWALKDEWVYDHAKDFSIHFMIIDDEVKFTTSNSKINAESFKTNNFDFKGFELFNNESHKIF